MTGPLFPSTSASHTPNPPFRTAKTAEQRSQSSASTPTPCLDKAVLGQRGGRYAGRQAGRDRHTHTHRHMRMTQTDQSPAPARTGQAQALVGSRFSSGRHTQTHTHRPHRHGVSQKHVGNSLGGAPLRTPTPTHTPTPTQKPTHTQRKGHFCWSSALGWKKLATPHDPANLGARLCQLSWGHLGSPWT